jgi:class 3 adenylate cyclase
MMIVFNDPLEVPEPEAHAVRMAVAMREALGAMRQQWHRQGYDLDHGIGITSGYATLGLIGFTGRWDYTALGSVANQAAREELGCRADNRQPFT